MADSIREKILKNVKTSLEVVRISNGYEIDLDNVQRYEQDGNDLRNTPCVIIIPDEEQKDDENVFPEVNCRLPVDLVLWFRHDKQKFDCSSDEVLSQLLASMEKAIFADNGHLRGGNAVTTRNLGNTPFETGESQPYCGFILRIEVFYKHLLTDPYS